MSFPKWRPAKPAKCRRVFGKVVRCQTEATHLFLPTKSKGLSCIHFERKDIYAWMPADPGLQSFHNHFSRYLRKHLLRHVCDKIRQQLQVLGDAGLLEVLGAGSYRLR